MKIIGQHGVIARIAGLGLALAVLLAMVLSCPIAGRAQASATSPTVPAAAPAKPAPAQAQAASGATKPAAGPHQGVKVHGHWVIEVKNPDGTVASHTEFENSLINPSLVSNLLTGGSSVGTWEVDLGSNTGSTPCGGTVCRIVQSISIFNKNCTTPPAASNQECGLMVTVSGTGASAGDIVLTGSTIALQAGSINVVSSDILTCGNSVSPATCDQGAGGTTGSENAFTEATNFPGSPIQVAAAGQIVFVTVTISFQ